MPLYVCEYRYKDDVKSFKKIKSWSSCVPDEIRKHEYDYEPYADDRTDLPAKVKSPFVREPGAPPPAARIKAKYHFAGDNKPSTAAEVKAAKAAEKVAAAREAKEAAEAASAAMDVDMADSPALDATSSAQNSLLADLSALTGGGDGLSPFDTSSPAASSQAFPPPAATRAEIAASAEFFSPLPQHISVFLFFLSSTLSPADLSFPMQSRSSATMRSATFSGSPRRQQKFPPSHARRTRSSTSTGELCSSRRRCNVANA
jgi:chromatin structure-remodeling complex subunit RSC1/2